MAPVPVYCWPVSRESAYVPLLFTGIEERYEPRYREDASLDEAIADRRAGRPAIVHVHWEEFLLRACASSAQAGDAVAAFARSVAELRAAGIPIVWTIHNEVPHEIPYHDAFFALRAVLARCAGLVLVHHAAAQAVLAHQVALDGAKVRILAHPSYLGRFEDANALHAGLTRPHDRWVQGFGWIRLQKGFGPMIDALPPAFLERHGLAIRISGAGDDAARVIAQRSRRADVVWDVRHVPDAEVPVLLRAATCVVLPYERVLTSGVALLVMSVGAVLVAVDVPQIRDVLPLQSRRFLYRAGDAGGLRDAVAAVRMLANDERRAVIDAQLAVAERLRPPAIAEQLARHYDGMLASA